MPKLDGRPLGFDIEVHPSTDAPGVSMTGFPSTYLDGATITAAIEDLAGTAAAANWTVTTGATSVVLSMPQADVAAIYASGRNPYKWTLVIALASGGKPATIGGSFSVSKSHKKAQRPVSATFESDPVGVDITIEQTVALSVLDLDGGGPEDEDGDLLDGGTP